MRSQSTNGPAWRPLILSVLALSRTHTRAHTQLSIPVRECITNVRAIPHVNTNASMSGLGGVATVLWTLACHEDPLRAAPFHVHFRTHSLTHTDVDAETVGAADANSAWTAARSVRPGDDPIVNAAVHRIAFGFPEVPEWSAGSFAITLVVRGDARVYESVNAHTVEIGIDDSAGVVQEKLRALPVAAGVEVRVSAGMDGSVRWWDVRWPADAPVSPNLVCVRAWAIARTGVLYTQTDNAVRVSLTRSAASTVPDCTPTATGVTCQRTLAHLPTDVPVIFRVSSALVASASAENWSHAAADIVISGGIPAEERPTLRSTAWLTSVGDTSASFLVEIDALPNADAGSVDNSHAILPAAEFTVWIEVADEAATLPPRVHAVVPSTAALIGTNADAQIQQEAAVTLTAVLRDLEPFTAYTVRLQAGHEVGSSWSSLRWSTPLQFVTLAATLNPPSILRPTPEDITHTSINLCWTDGGPRTSPGAMPFAVQVEMRTGRNHASDSDGWLPLNVTWDALMVQDVVDGAANLTLSCNAAPPPPAEAWLSSLERLRIMSRRQATPLVAAALIPNTTHVCQYCMLVNHLEAMRIHQFRVRALGVTHQVGDWATLHKYLSVQDTGLLVGKWSVHSPRLRTRPAPLHFHSAEPLPNVTSDIRVLDVNTLLMAQLMPWQELCSPTVWSAPLLTQTQPAHPCNQSAELHGGVRGHGWVVLEYLTGDNVVYAASQVFIEQHPAMPDTSVVPAAVRVVATRVAMLTVPPPPGTRLEAPVRVRVRATGASGGRAMETCTPGGAGAAIDVVLHVRPADAVIVVLGTAGADALGSAAGAGGWPDGGNGGYGRRSAGAGGGGSTAVYIVPQSSLATLRAGANVPATVWYHVRQRVLPDVLVAGGGGAGSGDLVVGAGGQGGMCVGSSGASDSSVAPGSSEDAYADNIEKAVLAQATAYVEPATGGGGADTLGQRGGSAGASSNVTTAREVDTAASIPNAEATAIHGSLMRGGRGAHGNHGGGGGGGGLFGGGGGGSGLMLAAGGGGGSSYVHESRVWRQARVRQPSAPILQLLSDQAAVITFQTGTLDPASDEADAAPAPGRVPTRYEVEIAVGLFSEDFRVIAVLQRNDGLTSVMRAHIKNLTAETTYRVRVAAIGTDASGTYQTRPSPLLQFTTRAHTRLQWQRAEWQHAPIEHPTGAGHESTGMQPRSLRGATLVSIADYLYLHGGLSFGQPCSDLNSPGTCQRDYGVQWRTWRLDPRSATWLALPLNKAQSPPAREQHAAAAIHGRMFVLSGRGHPDLKRDGGPFLDDMWELDVGEKEEERTEAVILGNPAGLRRNASRLWWHHTEITLPDGDDVLLPVILPPPASNETDQCVESLEVFVELFHPCMSQLQVSLVGPADAIDIIHGAVVVEPNTTHNNTVWQSLRQSLALRALSAEQQEWWRVYLDLRRSRSALLFDGSSYKVTPSFRQCSLASANNASQAYAEMVASPLTWAQLDEVPVPANLSQPDRLAIFTSSPAMVRKISDKLQCCPEYTVSVPADPTTAPSCDNVTHVSLPLRHHQPYLALDSRRRTFTTIRHRISLLRGWQQAVDDVGNFRGQRWTNAWFLRVADRTADGVAGLLKRWGMKAVLRPCRRPFRWRRVIPLDGVLPPPRIDAGSIVHQDVWYVWGGRGPAINYDLLNEHPDVWQFRARRWSVLPPVQAHVHIPFGISWPTRPSGSGAIVTTPRGLTTFGGYSARYSVPIPSSQRAFACEKGAFALEDINTEAVCAAWELSTRVWDYDNRTWNMVHPSFYSECFNSSSPQCVAPRHRVYHAIAWHDVSRGSLPLLEDQEAPVSGGSLWLYGGQDADTGSILDDLWELPLTDGALQL